MHIRLLLAALGLACSATAFTQGHPPATFRTPTGLDPVVHASSMALFRDRNPVAYYEEQYIINGTRVRGIPYLFRNWQDGVLTTADGRRFTGYKFRYDAFHQVVFFQSGRDSLEVSDEIKDFTLAVAYSDTTVKVTFVNASQYGKQKQPLYYEVLLDHPRGQLLKTNRKVIKQATGALPVLEGKKILDLECAYFYYNKASRKLQPIRPNGTNVSAILSLDEAAQKELQPGTYDFSQEAGIRAFFEAYFRRPS